MSLKNSKKIIKFNKKRYETIVNMHLTLRVEGEVENHRSAPPCARRGDLSCLKLDERPGEVVSCFFGKGVAVSRIII
jgi:hypothetical protein